MPWRHIGGICTVPCTPISALEGGEWSASRPGRFTPGERAPSTHWLGGWLGPRSSLKAVEKETIPSLCQESDPLKNLSVLNLKLEGEQQ